jgi:hypothetical protein
MKGLGKWVSTVSTIRNTRLKAQENICSSQGKSLLSMKEPSSGSGESAAVHFAQTSLLSFGDKSEKSDNDPAVVRPVETLTVTGSDDPVSKQEKEARSSGGIPSQ